MNLDRGMILSYTAVRPDRTRPDAEDLDLVEETENLVLPVLRDIRKEQAEQRTLLLGAVDYMRRMDDDMRRMEQRLDSRLSAVRDDLELMLKSELLGRLTHFETSIDERIEKLSERVSAVEV